MSTPRRRVAVAVLRCLFAAPAGYALGFMFESIWVAAVLGFCLAFMGAPVAVAAPFLALGWLAWDAPFLPELFGGSWWDPWHTCRRLDFVDHLLDGLPCLAAVAVAALAGKAARMHVWREEDERVTVRRLVRALPLPLLGLVVMTAVLCGVMWLTFPPLSQHEARFLELDALPLEELAAMARDEGMTLDAREDAVAVLTGVGLLDDRLDERLALAELIAEDEGLPEEVRKEARQLLEGIEFRRNIWDRSRSARRLKSGRAACFEDRYRVERLLQRKRQQAGLEAAEDENPDGGFRFGEAQGNIPRRLR